MKKWTPVGYYHSECNTFTPSQIDDEQEKNSKHESDFEPEPFIFRRPQIIITPRRYGTGYINDLENNEDILKPRTSVGGERLLRLVNLLGL